MLRALKVVLSAPRPGLLLARLPALVPTFLPTLLLTLLSGILMPAHSASFDCAKARSKLNRMICADAELSALNRMICADAELSALDSRVWDSFSAHQQTLSPAALAHVRERHLIWRRQRGWFDGTVSAISEDYRRHLAWLTHPLLPREGRYESDAGHAVQIDVDTAAPNRLAVQGDAAAPGRFTWVTPADGEIDNRIVRDAEAAAARPSLVVSNGAARLLPVFLGAPPGPVDQCRILLRFESYLLTLESEGACGTALAGDYRRPAPAVLPDPPSRANSKTTSKTERKN